MKYLVILFLTLLLSGFSIGSEKPVSAEQLKEWVSFLASDQMKGRRNGSPEMKIAAEWIAEKFKSEGLKPLLSNGEYIQNYTFTSKIYKTMIIGSKV